MSDFVDWFILLPEPLIILFFVFSVVTLAFVIVVLVYLTLDHSVLWALVFPLVPALYVVYYFLKG